MNCTIDREGITIDAGTLNRRILFGKVLRGLVYQRPERRMVFVNGFEPGLFCLSKNRLKINLCQKQFGLLIPMEFIWNEDELRVRIEAGLIVESNGSVYRLMELSLLPEFMSSTKNETGSYLIPIGSGALVEWTDREPVRNRDRIYMDQAEWEKFGLINCFASIQETGSILGIVSAGEFLAWADTELNQDGVNRIYVTDIYLSSPAFDYEYVSRDEYGEAQAAGIWAGGINYKACPTVLMNRYAGDFARIKELGFHGAYYLDAQATGLFRCTDPKHPADEKQFALSLCRILQYPRELYGAVSSELAPAYNLPFIDEVARIHGLDTCFRSHLPEACRTILRRTVPFYHIAVHGLVLYQASWVHGYRNRGGVWKGMLEELATGARPSMEVSFRGLANGDAYLDSLRDIAEAYKVSQLIQDTYVGLITDYREFSTEACRITYDSGHIVEVNCGKESVGNMKSQSVTISIQGKNIYSKQRS